MTTTTTTKLVPLDDNGGGSINRGRKRHSIVKHRRKLSTPDILESSGTNDEMLAGLTSLSRASSDSATELLARRVCIERDQHRQRRGFSPPLKKTELNSSTHTRNSSIHQHSALTSSSSSSSDRMEAVRLDFNSLGLYGVEDNLNLLRSSLTRISGDHCVAKQELILLRGASGTGKTALIESFADQQQQEQQKNAARGERTHIYESRMPTPIFAHGRCDQIVDFAEPYSGVSEAISNLVEEVVHLENAESNNRRNKTSIDSPSLRLDLDRSLDRDDVALLSLVVPGMSKLLTKAVVRQDNIKIKDDSTFVEKLTNSICTLLRCICSPQRPVVLSITALQWAENSGLEIIRAVATDKSIRGLMLILSYRDNEMDELHHLTRYTRQLIKDDDCRTIIIETTNMKQSDIHKLISDVTSLRLSETEDLSSITYHKTHGNPFAVIQFLKLLEEKHLITFSTKTYRFQYDADQIQMETNLSDNVVDLIASKIEYLSEAVRTALKIAACLSSRFDVATVAAIINAQGRQRSAEANGLDYDPPLFISNAQVQNALEIASEEGLLDQCSKTKFKFAHDRIQKAAYSLIPEGFPREKLHLLIGRMLSPSQEDNESEKVLLVAVNQLDRGSRLIMDPAERLELAQMNLAAAKIAKSQSAFFPAANYCECGLSLLEKDGGWKKHHDLVRDLSRLFCEMKSCVGAHKECREAIEIALKHTNLIEDRLPLLLIKFKIVANEDRNQAIELGLQTLRSLGEKVPSNPTKVPLGIELIRVRKLLRSKSDDDLINHEKVQSPNFAARMKILSLVISQVWFDRRRELFGLLVLRLTYLSLKHGLLSPEVFAWYGAFIGANRDYAEAFRFSQLAVRSLPRFEKEFQCSTMTVAAMFGSHLKAAYHGQMNQTLAAYRIGMEVGDTMNSFNAISCYVKHYFMSGLPLSPLLQDLKLYRDEMQRYGQSNIQRDTAVIHQAVLNLTGNPQDPLNFSGEIIHQDTFISSSNTYAIKALYVFRMMLAVFFGDVNVSIEMVDKIASLPKIADGAMCMSFYRRFFTGLACFAIAKRSGPRKFKIHGRDIIKEMKKYVKEGNINCHHLLMILLAEKANLNNDSFHDVKNAYDKAISLASKSGFIQHSALANECAGRYCQEQDNEAWANIYLVRACELYTEWGAMAKVRQMESTHGEILKVFDDVSVATGLKSTRSTRSVLSAESTGRYRGRARFSRRVTERHKGKLLMTLDDEMPRLANSAVPPLEIEAFSMEHSIDSIGSESSASSRARTAARDLNSYSSEELKSPGNFVISVGSQRSSSLESNSTLDSFGGSRQNNRRVSHRASLNLRGSITNSLKTSLLRRSSLFGGSRDDSSDTDPLLPANGVASFRTAQSSFNSLSQGPLM